MSTFSERLMLAMKERNMTQADLSKITGIPKSAISQYLSDRFSPKRDRTFIICRALNADPAWMIGLSDTKRDFSAPMPTVPVPNKEELQLIAFLRENPDVKKEVLSIINSKKKSTTVFRAAKSSLGTVPPLSEELSDDRIRQICEAPETDEDL